MRSEREIRELYEFLGKVLRTHDGSETMQEVCVNCRCIVEDKRWREPSEEARRVLAELPRSNWYKHARSGHILLFTTVDEDEIGAWHACLKWVLGEHEK